MSTSPC